MSNASDTESFLPLVSLSKAQRRALGTLIEKGITVPESYPLTLKALTAGCNQKSGRDPVTNYSEDDLLETLDQLREMGLAAVVHTESGRTERYRHYLRRRMPELSEPQVAILAELLLRGRQSVGDLRARASRMAPAGSLDSQEQLRAELTGLVQRKLIQADGPLDRRGVEVDHYLYEPQEGRKLVPRPDDDVLLPAVTPRGNSVKHEPVMSNAIQRTGIPPAAGSADFGGRIHQLETALASLRTENKELRGELSDCRQQIDRLESNLKQLREALGA
jgi:uncharacterized protein